VVAFETDFVGDFLDLMMTLRETEASRYTETDTPIFTCLSVSVGDALRSLGGSAAQTHSPA
jgi:chlorite dismutase